MVTEWNRTSKYEENIAAVRHEKVTKDTVVWDTDFVLNLKEHRMAVRLDRTYNEEALVMNAAFSTPHFITLLIEHGYLKDDAGFRVQRTPTYVAGDALSYLSDVFDGRSSNHLPVVYVSKTAMDTDPLNVDLLASRLKGAAHVLVDHKVGEIHGAVRVFYPSGSDRRKVFRYRSSTGDENARLEKVIRHVIGYWNSQRVDHLYTWQGVSSAVMRDRLEGQIVARQKAETARKKAESEVDQVYEAFDEDLRSQQAQLAELNRANEDLQYENQRLRAKLAAVDAAGAAEFGV